MMYTDLDTEWETWSSGHRQLLVNDVCAMLCVTREVQSQKGKSITDCT